MSRWLFRAALPPYWINNGNQYMQYYQNHVIPKLHAAYENTWFFTVKNPDVLSEYKVKLMGSFRRRLDLYTVVRLIMNYTPSKGDYQDS